MITQNFAWSQIFFVAGGILLESDPIAGHRRLVTAGRVTDLFLA